MGQGDFPVPYNEHLCADCRVLAGDFHCVVERIRTEYIGHIQSMSQSIT